MQKLPLSSLLDAMEQIAPARYAESWDNVGLLVGDPRQTISGVMLTIDYTPEVACEAAGAVCDAIVAYHPPIFDALKRVTASDRASAAIYDAIRRGVAIYSPHTALDVADGGTNDVLADILGLKDRAPLKLIETKASQYKLVTFVPHEAVEQVAEAIFNAGAGRIGKYSACSFRSSGTGTFFGEKGTSPAVGETGQLERAQEVRLETVVPIAKTASVIRALRQSHPYEEPAFDLNALAAEPEGIGIGRIGTINPPAQRQSLVDAIKRELGLEYLLISGPTDGNVSRAAVCAGACGNLLNEALTQKCELYLTGEIRHHDALKAASAGMTVVCTLHSNSERATLRRLKDRLTQMLPNLPIHLSQKDRDPFQIT
jgi:dinuclear metal center YbgI/SA1388 family protein